MQPTDEIDFKYWTFRQGSCTLNNFGNINRLTPDFLKYVGPAGPDCRKSWGPTDCLFYYLIVKIAKFTQGPAHCRNISKSL